ncbi:putative glycerophosphoryl diester phosphodiesterase [Agrobacterium rubi TR3 = NBRC 13261]|uniref:Putative glycerophosphoryl diester phosphodiesterase n=1 Tax=Agrobacterium rubi TR3 = NBRC 13261 TaxID=1368415 RepID=A0A081CTT2_9HYPH|nr:glycerophosphodiester phosphodiesterase family protein [Agrobacterium rubi]MBP1878404.1 glycerophosphoryl diester phosphodiesterase [Agrobacterium rubi]GAK70078.1 putative glycerophosphoryl diester phosphodiesterase [Agrobacterium rubi TR3 = NBRC 13261]
MTKIVGHRGARNLWPENSLTGFRNVLALDVDAVEFDVHLTDAGELVVIHDATLDRTTDMTGHVRTLTPQDRETTYLEGSADTVPTLGDVLAVLAKADGKQLHVEIKSDEAKRPYPGITEKVVAEIERFGLASRCHLTSFDVSVLEECRRVAPHIARLVSVNAEWAAKQGGLETFLHSVDGLVDIVAIHHELMAAEWTLITQTLPLHRLGVWTLNDEALIRPWLERKIGHLTSDSPDLVLRLHRGIHSQMQPT